MLLYFPGMTLAACMPLLAMRSLRGWSLTRDGQLEVPRSEHRVEDLFIVSIVVACAVALGKLSIVPTASPGVDIVFMIVFAGAITASCYPSNLDCFSLAFTGQAFGWLRHRLFASCAYDNLFISLTMLSVSVAVVWRAFMGVVWLIPLCAVNWLASISALRLSGYQLTGYAATVPVTATEVDPLSADEAAPAKRAVPTGRRQARYLSAAVASLTLCTILIIAFYDRVELQRFQAQADPKKYYDAAVESVDYLRRDIVAVKLSPSATRADLEKVLARTPTLAETLFGWHKLWVTVRF